MKNKILNKLVCPKCKGSLEYHKKNQQLICVIDKLAYPIRDDLPILIVEEAEDVGK